MLGAASLCAQTAAPPAQINVAIVVQNGMELLDFAGPGEVFAATGSLDARPFRAFGFGAIDRLRDAAPRAIVHENTRFVDNGTIITTAGISAGIDGSLHLVSRLLGAEAAEGVARYMEYDNWKPNAGLIVARPAAVP